MELLIKDLRKGMRGCQVFKDGEKATFFTVLKVHQYDNYDSYVLIQNLRTGNRKTLWFINYSLAHFWVF